MKKVNPAPTPLSDATGHIDPMPTLPPLRTFIVRTDIGERVVGAHTFEYDNQGVLGLFVFFHDPVNGLCQAPRLVVQSGWELEEINPLFPELATEAN